jgi:cation diffusion facilitator CzcD-associated flavoprotein CzcO
VAVIGTGASAVQMIPELAIKVEELTVFQRTACWIMPRLNHESSPLERRLLRTAPGVRKAIRGLQYGLYETYGSFNFIDRRFVNAFEAIAKAQLRTQVRDRNLRRKLTPDYRLGCKRTAVSSTYLPTFNRDNVHLVTDAITEVTPTGIVDAAGVHHEVDTIVFGTGFTLLHHLTEDIVGRAEQSIAEVYRERPQSYLGVSMAGFPNLFLTSGPFGGAGNQSFLFMLEAQFTYIVEALSAMRRNDWAVVDVKPEVQDRFVDDAERRSADSIWLNGGCSGYYTTADGKRNSGIWPDWSFNYRRKTKRFVAANYDVQSADNALVRTGDAR